MTRLFVGLRTFSALGLAASLTLAACGGGSESNQNESADSRTSVVDQSSGGEAPAGSGKLSESDLGTPCATSGEKVSIPNGTGICAADASGALIWQRMGPDGAPAGSAQGAGDGPGNGISGSSMSDEPDYFMWNWDVTTTKPREPACTSATPLSVLPTPANLIDFIWPLGYSQPGAHALPVPHHNVHVPEEKSTDENGVERRTKLIDPVVSPGNSTLVGLARNIYTTKNTSGAKATYEEYMLSLHICGTLYVVLNHLDLVPVSWLEAVKQSSVREECNSGQDGAEVCMWSGLSVPIKAGERLGRSSGRAHGWDIGATDASRPMEHRIDPSAFTGRWSMATCVFDLFTAEAKAQLTAKLKPAGNCGRVDYDYPNTLSGIWLALGMRERAAIEDLHIALFPKYTYDGTLRFSIGLQANIAGLQGGIYEFKPEPSGLRNPDFVAVKPGEVACFDGLTSPIASGKLQTTRIYATMQSANGVETISIAGAGTGKCGSGPYSMPSSVTTFERRVGT
jgi:hypothetical protein